MKTIHLSMLSALAIILVITAILADRSMASRSSISKTIKGDGFVVLELFTSEGCSSCPPADELLAKVQREAGNLPVYVLAYHVDYWDHQGWRDVFSNPDYSKRQYEYASKLRTQVYTPQVVVNGKSEFVGSNAAALNFAVTSGLSASPAIELQLHGNQKKRRMEIHYKITGKPDQNELLIAVIQKNAIHRIKLGENKGRILSHAQIVRSLQAFPIGQYESGTVNVVLPEDYEPSGWEVIGLLQGKQTRAIQGAGRVVLSAN
ncbi:MAG TPA: DUF1223 domain-containing protein [Pedobacter sp.]|nr:DUF1223 domain-containing protein [Pedobacter sp.]